MDIYIYLKVKKVVSQFDILDRKMRSVGHEKGKLINYHSPSRFLKYSSSCRYINIGLFMLHEGLLPFPLIAPATI